jgi:hypothetical protein
LGRLEIGKDNVGSLRSWKNFTNLFGFGSITYYWVTLIA